MNKHINRQEEDIIQSYMDFKEKDNTENTELMEQNVEISKKKDEQNENEARKNPMKKKQNSRRRPEKKSGRISRKQWAKKPSTVCMKPTIS